MTPTRPWTVAVADGASPSNPSIAYVTAAHDRADAIARVHAHHSTVSGWSTERILTGAACPGVPPTADGYGWTDLRGIKALRLVIEPAQVRDLARQRQRRWNTMMAPYYAADDDAAAQIPPSAWHAYDDEAEAICQTLGVILLGAVRI